MAEAGEVGLGPGSLVFRPNAFDLYLEICGKPWMDCNQRREIQFTFQKQLCSQVESVRCKGSDW